MKLASILILIVVLNVLKFVCMCCGPVMGRGDGEGDFLVRLLTYIIYCGASFVKVLHDMTLVLQWVV